MSVIRKIEALLEDDYGGIPLNLIPAAKAAEMPKGGPEDMVGIGAEGSRDQIIKPSQWESNQVPEGLNMTGDPSDPAGNYMEPSDHSSIVKALQHAINHTTGE